MQRHCIVIQIVFIVIWLQLGCTLGGSWPKLKGYVKFDSFRKYRRPHTNSHAESAGTDWRWFSETGAQKRFSTDDRQDEESAGSTKSHGNIYEDRDALDRLNLPWYSSWPLSEVVAEQEDPTQTENNPNSLKSADVVWEPLPEVDLGISRYVYDFLNEPLDKRTYLNEPQKKDSGMRTWFTGQRGMWQDTAGEDIMAHAPRREELDNILEGRINLWSGKHSKRNGQPEVATPVFVDSDQGGQVKLKFDVPLDAKGLLHFYWGIDYDKELVTLQVCCNFYKMY